MAECDGVQVYLKVCQLPHTCLTPACGGSLSEAHFSLLSPQRQDLEDACHTLGPFVLAGQVDLRLTQQISCNSSSMVQEGPRGRKLGSSDQGAPVLPG